MVRLRETPTFLRSAFLRSHAFQKPWFRVRETPTSEKRKKAQEIFGGTAAPKAAGREICFWISKMNMRTSAAKCEFYFDLRIGPPTLSWWVRQERGALSGKCRLGVHETQFSDADKLCDPRNVVWLT